MYLLSLKHLRLRTRRYILTRKRNATLIKMVVSFFWTNKFIKNRSRRGAVNKCYALLQVRVPASSEPLSVEPLVAPVIKYTHKSKTLPASTGYYPGKGTTHLLSNNAIAKYRYFPCIQYQNQTAVAYGCGAATRILRQPPLLKSQSPQNLTVLLESKRVDKIKSCNLCFCQRSLRLRDALNL